MPSNPTSSALHVDTLLTEMAIGYGTDLAKTYVADRACTVTPVQKQSDKYMIWNKGDFYRSDMALRGDGDRSVGSGQRLSNTNYFAEVYALHTKLTDRQRKNSDVDIESAKVRYLMNQAKLKRDILYADTLFKASVWAGFSDQTGVAATPGANQFIHWSDYTNGDPIGDITDKVVDLELAAGVPGVELVGICNTKVFEQLRHHPDMLDRIKYTAGVERPAAVTPEVMAAVLGIDTLIIAKAAKNTAAEGQTASMSRVFGDHFLLQYRSMTPDDETPTAATLFSWSEFDEVTPEGAAIFSWYEESKRATYYEAEMACDIKATATDLGGIFLSCVA
jgi:hypothetical protein